MQQLNLPDSCPEHPSVMQLYPWETSDKQVKV